MIDAFVLLGLALIAFAFGRWGHDHVDQLMPRHLDARERILQARVLRHGAIACQVVGGLLVIAAIVRVLN